MKTVPRFKDSPEKLENLELELVTPGFKGEWLDHCTLYASCWSEPDVVETSSINGQYEISIANKDLTMIAKIR